jgi:hypothetical protein
VNVRQVAPAYPSMGPSGSFESLMRIRPPDSAASMHAPLFALLLAFRQ